MTIPPRIYRPGEVDDAAYGPAEPPLAELPRPRWEPETNEEREAFIVWCFAMLDRIAEDKDLEAALRKIMEDEDAVLMLRQVADQPAFEAARKLMPLLLFEDFERFRYGRHDHRRKLAGRKANEKIKAARVDNGRLTVLWRKHFEEEARKVQPTRLQILQRRHGLDDGETETLENYITKLK